MTEKLERDADCVRAEGWKWVEVALDFPYGHTYDLRRLIGEQRPLTEEDTAAHDALRAEFDKLDETYAEANDISEEVDHRLAEIETALAALDERPVIYEPEADRQVLLATHELVYEVREHHRTRTYRCAHNARQCAHRRRRMSAIIPAPASFVIASNQLL